MADPLTVDLHRPEIVDVPLFQAEGLLALVGFSVEREREPLSFGLRGGLFPFLDQVVAEVIDGDVDFSMVLSAEATKVTLPPEFLDDTEDGDVVKYEVLCKEETGNQTITERTFEL